MAREEVVVYTEVSLGKTIIGKNRKLDVFAVRRSDQCALALETKYQEVQGTTDEKIPYALKTLRRSGSRLPRIRRPVLVGRKAEYTLRRGLVAPCIACLSARTSPGASRRENSICTLIAAVFGFWDHVIPEERTLFGEPATEARASWPEEGGGAAAPRPEEDCRRRLVGRLERAFGHRRRSDLEIAFQSADDRRVVPARARPRFNARVALKSTSPAAGRRPA